MIIYIHFCSLIYSRLSTFWNCLPLCSKSPGTSRPICAYQCRCELTPQSTVEFPSWFTVASIKSKAGRFSPSLEQVWARHATTGWHGSCSPIRSDRVERSVSGVVLEATVLAQHPETPIFSKFILFQYIDRLFSYDKVLATSTFIFSQHEVSALSLPLLADAFLYAGKSLPDLHHFSPYASGKLDKGVQNRALFSRL